MLVLECDVIFVYSLIVLYYEIVFEFLKKGIDVYVDKLFVVIVE